MNRVKVLGLDMFIGIFYGDGKVDSLMVRIVLLGAFDRDVIRL